MSPEVLCSFLMPIRSNPNLTLKSLRSIVKQSSDTISYEVLIAIDSDDNENLNIISQIYEINLSFSLDKCIMFVVAYLINNTLFKSDNFNLNSF